MEITRGEARAENRRRRQCAWLALALAFCAYITFVTARELLG
jgi:hypothetical protein